MKHIRHCLTALFAIAISLMVWADSGELFTSGKLSSSLINCIVQDKYGYIWVGTEYGLSKFDGYRFTNYLHNEEDTTSITDNIISDLLVDKKGNLWIGCAKGLMRYNYETNDFARLQFPDGRKPRIYSMVESHNGDILLGTAGYRRDGFLPSNRCVAFCHQETGDGRNCSSHNYSASIPWRNQSRGYLSYLPEGRR